MEINLSDNTHHVPQTRLLTLRLLKPLYDRGFRYLAIETLSDSIDATVQQGFPTLETGYYTAEPTYALIVREALKLGYKLVPYESSPKCDPFHDRPEKCQNLREEGQANNLVERVFKTDPKAKMIVHAGYGHVDKKGGTDEWKWIPMARYLWEMTKIEPFSVNQTFYYEKGQPNLNSEVYNQTTHRFHFQRPTVLINRNTKAPFIAAKYDGHYDLQVFLPRLTMRDQRPAWKFLIPNTKEIKIVGWTCPPTHQCLVQAVLKNELGAKFVPVDQALVSTQQFVALHLLPGEYEIRLVEDNDRVLERQTRTVLH